MREKENITYELRRSTLTIHDPCKKCLLRVACTKECKEKAIYDFQRELVKPNIKIKVTQGVTK